MIAYTPEEEEQGRIAEEILMTKGKLSIDRAEAKHTPTPWRIEEEEEMPDRIHAIYGRDNATIVETDSGYYNPSRIDAEFIVRAVNSHEALLEVAKRLKKYAWCNVPAAMSEELKAVINLACDAIDQAEAKP